MTCKEIVRHPLQWWRIALFAFCVIGPIWYALIDREPPYVRLSGSITPPNSEPGTRINIVWNIRPTRICRPAGVENVTRRIVDYKGVVWGDFAVPSIFGAERDIEEMPRMIARQLDLPGGIARGPAVYKSTACYICDPFTLQRFLPVCITGPDIRFNIGVPRP